MFKVWKTSTSYKERNPWIVERKRTSVSIFSPTALSLPLRIRWTDCRAQSAEVKRLSGPRTTSPLKALIHASSAAVSRGYVTWTKHHVGHKAGTPKGALRRRREEVEARWEKKKERKQERNETRSDWRAWRHRKYKKVKGQTFCSPKLRVWRRRKY